MDAPIRVLLLEDTVSDAELILRELARASLEVTAHRVETEAEFRRHLAEWNVDIILADYSLPRFDGPAALRIAREADADMPFIFVSGSIGDERGVLALRDGATDYILKDRMSRLGPAVNRALNERKELEIRRAAQAAIVELSRRNEMILDCAAEGIIGVNRDAAIIFTNPAAMAILGRTRQELRDCPNTHDLFHHTRPDGTPYPREDCPMLKTLLDGRKRAITGEVFWRAGGRPFAVEYESAPILEAGQLAGCVLTFRDVTESQAMKRQLELEKRIGSLGRVAATIAHEFNNVLMGIDPFAEMIRRTAAGNENVFRAADQISISVRRGRRVTEEILRFTQPSEPAMRHVDVIDWLRSTEPELCALAGSGVRIRLSLPEGPLVTTCDAAQLQQVVTNLVLNARDASPEGGAIMIALARQGGNLLLTVRDEGPGIPLAALENVFEPLFTTKRTGTGLGLAVARQIVTQHNGTLEVSNVPGGGAEFRIKLPISETPAAVAAGPARHAAALTFHKLLLVEDDQSVSEGLTALLRLEELDVLVIDRGRAVIDTVETFRPHVVVLDLTLPDIDGTEVFRLIRERYTELPVVFSTGHGGEIELAAELGDQYTTFLRKPYEIDTLLAALQRLTSIDGANESAA